MEQEPLLRRYRPDIQGLRAVAVALVLFYHAGVGWISGGYVGVDVFFVISGYLITGLIVNEIHASGRFAIASFYARRARRLLPASALALVAAGVITFFVLPSTRWPTIAGDIAASAVYLVNWRFAAQSVDYLSAGSALSPVLHFWSLAVEEQFYLLWPVLLLVLLAVRKHLRWRLETLLLAGVAAVAIPSLVWSVLMTATTPGPAYFVSTTRLWEFGVGAALALGADQIARIPRRAAVALGYAGLTAVVGTAILYTEETAFPGVAAILPVAGTAALIIAGLTRDASNSPLVHALSIGPMQWIGKISYSLYLWHWPLIVGATWVWGDTAGNLPLSTGFLVVAFSTAPAWLSYRLVEAPIHFSDFFGTVPRHALALGVVCTAIGLSVSLFLSASVPAEDSLVVASPAVSTDHDNGGTDVPTSLVTPPSPPEGDTIGEAEASGVLMGALVLGDDPGNDPNMKVADIVPSITPSPVAALSDKARLDGEKCIADPAKTVSCEYGSPDAETVVAVVGDSKMHQWLNALQEIADDRDWRLVTYLANGCPLSRIPVHRDPALSAACTAYNQQRFAALLGSDDIDYVITSQRATKAYLPDSTREQRVQALAEDLRSTWTELENSGIRVIVIPDNATPSTDVPDCVAGHPDQLSECAFPFEQGIARSAAPTQFLAMESLNTVKVADVQPWICSGDMCPVVIGNVLVYRQGSHLTATYVETLIPRLDEALADAMSEE